MQNCQYFLDSLHNIIDFYSGVYDNRIVLGDFNMDPSHMQLSAFMEHYNYYNLIKNSTCFNGDGLCIDLILTNSKYCFKNTNSFETGISDHHHLIYSMFKQHLRKKNPKNYLSQLLVRVPGGSTLLVWVANSYLYQCVGI